MSAAGAQATRQRRQKNGTLLEVKIDGVPLNMKGELQGTLALYQDITERQRAEAELLKMLRTWRPRRWPRKTTPRNWPGWSEDWPASGI